MSALSKATLAAMLKKASAIIAEEHENLCKLDAATGDGDHGIAMLRTMEGVSVAVEETAGRTMGDMLKGIATKVMMCGAGSTSPLLGSYFLGLASAATSDELTPEQAAAMFKAGLDRFQKTSKAALGDKTMLDALRPATEVLIETLTANGDVAGAFSAAAEAAAEGAEKTKGYAAKLGRARTMGERAVGHYDPGAVSIAHIFRGFAAASC